MYLALLVECKSVDEARNEFERAIAMGKPGVWPDVAF